MWFLARPGTGLTGLDPAVQEGVRRFRGAKYPGAAEPLDNGQSTPGCAGTEAGTVEPVPGEWSTCELLADGAFVAAGSSLPCGWWRWWGSSPSTAGSATPSRHGSSCATRSRQRRSAWCRPTFRAPPRRPTRLSCTRTEGTLRSPAFVARIRSMLDEVARLPHVRSVSSPYEVPGQMSRNGTVAFATVTFDKRSVDLPIASVAKVMKVAQEAGDAAGRSRSAGRTSRTPRGRVNREAPCLASCSALAVLGIAFGVALCGVPSPDHRGHGHRHRLLHYRLDQPWLRRRLLRPDPRRPAGIGGGSGLRGPSS